MRGDQGDDADGVPGNINEVELGAQQLAREPVALGLAHPARPPIAHTTRNWSTRLGLVAAGLGITVIPGQALAALPAGLRTVAVTDSHWTGRATLAVTRPRPSAQAQAMVTALQHQAAHLHNA